MFNVRILDSLFYIHMDNRYQGCLNINVSSFITVFTDILEQIFYHMMPGLEYNAMQRNQ